MNENRPSILEMLAAEQNQRRRSRASHLRARRPPATNGTPRRRHAQAQDQGQFLRVLVETEDRNEPTTVNVRVPCSFSTPASVSPALSLTGPRAARRGSQQARRSADPSQIKPENLTELIDI